MITIEDFLKVEMRAGTVLEAENVEGSEKLIRLTVDLGEERPRIVFTGMRRWKTTEDFKGKQLLFVTNLEPRKMMGEFSEGMIIATDGDNGPVLLNLEEEVSPGAQVK